MLFKMMLDASGKEEKPIVRGLLKHLILGFAAGVAVGALLLVILLLSLHNMDLHMPLIWAFAMMLQCGPVGGLIGVGVYVSRITDRGKDDDDDRGPGGNARAEDTSQIVIRPASTPANAGARPVKA